MALDLGTQLLTINNRLSPEVMSEIFTLYITVSMHNLDDFDFKQDVSTPSPLSLTSVCRYWRSIAQSTPALWTSLKIYIPYRNMPQRIEDIQQWISRSGQLPLSIQVHHHSSAPLKSSDPLVDELINLVKSYSHRWESLEITLIPELLPRFSDSSSRPSILKTLILAPVKAFFRRPFNIGASCPSPTYVSLSSTYVWPLGICWDDVTHFTARYMSVGQALEILRLAPQLQEFILFELWESSFDHDLPSSPVLHSRLETLHVYLSLEGVSYKLMDKITLPSLKHFNYTGYTHCYLPFVSIIDFLNRSGCSLETFSLRDAEIHEDDHDEIFHLLCAMPHLETLTLGSRYITDRFLNMLAATAAALIRREGQTAVPFLAKLQSLKCIGRPIFSWSWLPNVFGSCGTNESSDSASESGSCGTNESSDSASESGTSDSDTSESDTPKSGTIDRRPLRSFTVVQDVDDSDYPEADVKAELKRLREEGYVVDIVFGRVKSVLATM